MKKLNVFIDGSWLFKVCKACGILANKTCEPEKPFGLDFSKLNSALLSHVHRHDQECDALGDLYYATSIFDIPNDVDSWTENPDLPSVSIEIVKRNAHIRGVVTGNAIKAGYKEDAIFRPRLKPYMVEKLKEGSFQEKQVDASVVALLVRSAITKPEDYHLIITGDSDIIPAIKVAYPEYSKNVVVATTHPDQLRAENRQSSFSFNNIEFQTPVFYLHEHVGTILYGKHVYECGECHRFFKQSTAFPKNKQPFCPICQLKRT